MPLIKIVLYFFIFSFLIFWGMIISGLFSLFIIGIMKDIFYLISPLHKRINTLFVIKKHFTGSNKPIEIHMVISFTSFKKIRSYHKEHESEWVKHFLSQLEEVLVEISSNKYNGQEFSIKTHTGLKNQINKLAKKGVVEIIDSEISHRRYLYETLKLPFQVVRFYKITFRIKSKEPSPSA